MPVLSSIYHIIQRPVACWSALPVLLLLAGCIPVEQMAVGELSRDAEHALIPKTGDIYTVHNLRKSGGKVFLFASPEVLTRCFEELEKHGSARDVCFDGAVADVEDGTLIRALDCDSPKVAACMVQAIEGDNAGAKGAVLWDWMKIRERKASPKK